MASITCNALKPSCPETKGEDVPLITSAKCDIWFTKGSDASRVRVVAEIGVHQSLTPSLWVQSRNSGNDSEPCDPPMRILLSPVGG